MITLLDAGLESLIFLLVIVAIAGLIVLGVILVKKYVKPLQIQKPDIDEETAVKEELDRVLVPIDDEEIQKQMDEDMKKNAK
mgnify:CR=1 FL=1